MYNNVLNHNSWSPIQLLSLLILVITTLKTSDAQLPLTNYQHEIIYPGIGNLQGTFRLNDGSPVSINGGFHLKLPPPIPFLPPPPPRAISGLPAAVNRFFQRAGNAFRQPLLTAVNLFTPNTVQQPAETAGQVENYRKALEEEEREAAKQQQEELDELIGAQRPKSFVDVKVDGGSKPYNYKYSH